MGVHRSDEQQCCQEDAKTYSSYPTCANIRVLKPKRSFLYVFRDLRMQTVRCAHWATAFVLRLHGIAPPVVPGQQQLTDYELDTASRLPPR